MPGVTVSRGDVSCEQVAETLRRALGLRYHVRSGAAIDHGPRDGLLADELDTIVVGRGSDRWFRAQVTIARRSGQTRLYVIPGGLPGTWPGGLQLINRVGIARSVHRALEASADLR